MDEATRARIFEPFTTAGRSGHRPGLAVVHGIVTDSGGLSVDSVRPRHARRCCCASGGGWRAQVAALRQARSAAASNILLADDDEVVGLTTQALPRAPSRVTRVSSGLAAVEAVREARIATRW